MEEIKKFIHWLMNETYKGFDDKNKELLVVRNEVWLSALEVYEKEKVKGKIYVIEEKEK